MLSNILPSHSQPKLSFTLNPDTGLPDGFRLHEHRASNKMIEEFMLLANMAVARRIYTAFPEAAVLRRHPHPKMDMLDKIVEQLGFLGVEIEGELQWQSKIELISTSMNEVLPHLLTPHLYLYSILSTGR